MKSHPGPKKKSRVRSALLVVETSVCFPRVPMSNNKLLPPLTSDLLNTFGPQKHVLPEKCRLKSVCFWLFVDRNLSVPGLVEVSSAYMGWIYPLTQYTP